MGTAKTIMKNSIVLLLSQIITFAIGFAYITYTARYLGVEEFGAFSFAIAFSGIFTIFIDFGINTLVVRDLSRDKSHADVYLGNIFALKLLTSTIVYLLIIVAVQLLGYSGEILFTIYLMSLSNVLLSLNNTFYAIFQSYEKFEYQSVGTVFSSLIMLAGILIAVRMNFGIVEISAVYVITNLIVLLFNGIICFKRFTIPRCLIDKKLITGIACSAIPFGLSTIFVTGINSIDVIMLRNMAGNEAVGLYSAAGRIISYFIYVPVIINLAVYPAMTRFYVSSRKSLGLITKEYLKFMLIISAPIGAGIFILAPKIIGSVYGDAYVSSIIIMQMLIWSTVFIYNNAAYVRLFESVNKQVFVTFINGICLAVNIILNLILIPKYSYFGACITSVVTQLMFITMITYFAYQQGYGLEVGRLAGIVARIIAASAVLIVSLLALNSFNILIQVIVSAALYFGVLVALKGLDNDDVKILRSLARRS